MARIANERTVVVARRMKRMRERAREVCEVGFGEGGKGVVLEVTGMVVHGEVGIESPRPRLRGVYVGGGDGVAIVWY